MFSPLCGWWCPVFVFAACRLYALFCMLLIGFCAAMIAVSVVGWQEACIVLYVCSPYLACRCHPPLGSPVQPSLSLLLCTSHLVGLP
eukprot:11422474-Prorocentrum_lima.AAC.1